MKYNKSDLLKYDTHEHHNHISKPQKQKLHRNHYDTQGTHHNEKGNHYSSCKINQGTHHNEKGNHYSSCNKN